MGGYTTRFKDESLYSRENLEMLKKDFTNLGAIDGGDTTFKNWVLNIDQRSGVFDLKIDNKEMEEDDFDKDINTVGISRQDKVAEKRRLFFLELYKPLNNPKNFKDSKIDLKDRLNKSKSRQNWENFAQENNDILKYWELLSKTAEEEREILYKFLKKSKKSSRVRERDDEEYTPNDKQNELNFFANVSKEFAPDDSTPILKKSDYITFEFLEELKDICSGKKDDKEDDMKNVIKQYNSPDLNDDTYELNDDMFSLDDDQLGLNAEFNEKQKKESDKKLKYYFPELHNFLSMNSEDLINVTDQYKIQISKLGGDKKVEENKKEDDDDYYRDKLKEKSSVSDLKLQLERINVAALNFIIAFAISDLKNTYVENYSNIKILSNIKEKHPQDKDIDCSGYKACAFLSTLISNAKTQLKIHEGKMASLEEDNDVNLMHAKEKHDFIPSIVDEYFPKDQSPEIENLKEQFYDDPKEILNRISDDKTSNDNKENKNPLKKFLYDESGLKFIVNVNSQFNKKIEEKNKLNNKRIKGLDKSIERLHGKKNQKNEAKNREIDSLANIQDYHSYEILELMEQSESYKKIFDNIINHFREEMDLCCDNAIEKIEELIGTIDIIRNNYKSNPTFVKGIVDRLRRLKYDIGMELGTQNRKYGSIDKHEIDSIKRDLDEIDSASGWNEENEEILDDFFEKEEKIKEKIREIDEEINSDEVKNAMKSAEEIKSEITKLEEINESKKDDNSETLQISNESTDENRVQYLNNFQENNYNSTTRKFSNNRNNFYNFNKNNHHKNNYYRRNYKPNHW